MCWHVHEIPPFSGQRLNNKIEFKECNLWISYEFATNFQKEKRPSQTLCSIFPHSHHSHDSVDTLTSWKEIWCNRIGVKQADTNEIGKHFFQAKTTVKETDVKDAYQIVQSRCEVYKNSGRWSKDQGLNYCFAPLTEKLYGKYTLSILHLYFRSFKWNRSML